MRKSKKMFSLRIMHLTWIAMGLTMLVSCQRKKVLQPENLIPRDKMVQIIAEIQFADAALITAENQRKINRTEIPEYYSDLLQRFEITKQQFDTSLYFYSQDLEELSKIYDDVLLILQNKQSQLQEKQ